MKIIACIDETPAITSGLKSQDMILAIDNTPLIGKTLPEAVKLMRDAPGKQVTLLIKREGKKRKQNMSF